MPCVSTSVCRIHGAGQGVTVVRLVPILGQAVEKEADRLASEWHGSRRALQLATSYNRDYRKNMARSDYGLTTPSPGMELWASSPTVARSVDAHRVSGSQV